MNCEAFQESIVQYYLGELDDVASAQFDEHIAGGCPSCTRALNDIAAGVDVLFDSAPVSQLAESTRAAILRQVERSKSCSAGSTSPNEASTAAFVGYRATAAGGCSVAAGWLLAMILFPATQVGSQNIGGPSSQPGISSQASSAGRASSGALAGLERLPSNLRMAEDEFRTTSFVSLHQPSVPAGPIGKVIWDPLAGEIHFFGSGFRQPPNGMQAVLWAEDPIEESVLPVPLEIDSNGTCRAVVSASNLVPPMVYVTIERSGEPTELPAGEKLLSAEM